jgi:hypothetical protein
MAAEEPNPKPKAEFEKQAAAYRKLAAGRASKLGLPLPPKTIELRKWPWLDFH